MHVVAALLLLVAFASANPVTDPTICENGPCQNGASCFPQLKATPWHKMYKCLCVGDFGGYNCQISDPCSTCPVTEGEIVYCRRTSSKPNGRICINANTMKVVRSLIDDAKSIDAAKPPKKKAPRVPARLPEETDEQYEARLEKLYERLLAELPEMPARLPNETDDQYETRLGELVHKMLGLYGSTAVLERGRAGSIVVLEP